MEREGELSTIFKVLLFGVLWPAGCGGGYGDWGVCSSPYRRIVDAEALAEAMMDEKLSDAECISLCEGSRPYDPADPPTPPTTGATTDVCGETSAGDPSTGDGSSTTTDTSTSTGTSGDTTTTEDTGGASPTEDSGMSGDTDGDVCSIGDDMSTGYNYDDFETSGSVHTCKPIEGSLDSITCFFVDCAFGRRPTGLRSEGRAVGTRALGRWLAEGAHLEAASVPAFERLAAALAEHHAPAELQERALAAAADERRHAASMTALAGDFGGEAATPELEHVPAPGLLELACDNAVQGCVGETWAALIACHQADAAVLPQIRATMVEIAADETEHAELAWAIDAWLQTRLSPVERREVAAARSAACDALRERLGGATDHPALIAAGVPRRATALSLHEGLRRALWAPTLA